ncbi:MAG: hypothetical protein IKX06_00790 [Clostridia bacterium]|nr:hypothetical protein [Clostridia bacterium]
MNTHVYHKTIMIAALFVALTVVPICSLAKSDMSVYASLEEQQSIYEMLEKQYPAYAEAAADDCVIPVYHYDVSNYKKDNEISLEKAQNGKFCYYLKAEADESKGFRGSGLISVTVNNGKIESAGMVYPGSGYERVLSSSPSYADYAEDIRIALGKDSVISPKNVRFVYTDGIGNCFYIEDGNDSVFVSLLYLNVSWADPYRVSLSVADDCDFVIIRTGDELEAVAKAVLQKKEYVDKNGGGGDGAVFVPEVELTGLKAEHFRDVTDVSSYLGQDYRSASMVFPEAFAQKRPVWPFFAAGGAVVLLGSLTAVAVVIVRKKHAQKCADESPDGSEA